MTRPVFRSNRRFHTDGGIETGLTHRRSKDLPHLAASRFRPSPDEPWVRDYYTVASWAIPAGQPRPRW